MQTTLPISRLINVSVNLAPAGAQGQNLNTLLILGSSPIIDVVTRMRSYSSIEQVAIDFGTTSPEYLAALLWFEQQPQPTGLLIGRWAKTASNGRLIGASLSAAQQSLDLWKTINKGTFTLSVDNAEPAESSLLDFSNVASLNAVAALIQGVFPGTTVVWNAAYSRFEITSHSTGAGSKVSFMTPPSGGTVPGVQTDISGMLGLTASSSGAYVADGIAAESAISAVTLFDTKFGQQWYGLSLVDGSDSDNVAIAAFIEASKTFHFLGATTQEAEALVPGDTTSLGALLKALGYKRTAVQFSSSNPYAVVSLLARLLTTDWTANNTAITLMYKQEPGIVPENLNETQIDALEANHINAFVAYNNNTAIIEPGVCSSGDFIDTVVGTAALAIGIQTAVYNVLFTSENKVPQTDAGTHLLTTAIEQACGQFVNDGLLGPGTWTVGGFGALKQGDFLGKGFYVYAPPLSTQATADRAKRISVPIQVAAKLAGAVHSVNVIVNVNS